MKRIVHKKIKKIKEKSYQFLFNKKWIYRLCYIIPIRFFRHKIWNSIVPFIDNFVYRIDKKGKVKRLSFFSKISGLKIRLSGTDNKIYVHMPFRFEDCEIEMCGTNNVIIIEPPSELTAVGIAGLKIRMRQNRRRRLLHIKKGFSIRSGTFIVAGHNRKIIIGKDCLFSANINLRTNDAHHIYDAKTDILLNAEQDIIIGDKVWCGQKITILKGSIVPPNSVIGTGSIYTHSSEKNPDMEQIDGNIYAGIPARCVKKHIYWKG